MATLIFGIICVLASAFLLYFLVQVHRELHGSRGNMTLAAKPYHAHAAILQMRFAVSHKRCPAEIAGPSKESDCRGDVVQLELPDLGPIPLVANQSRR